MMMTAYWWIATYEPNDRAKSTWFLFKNKIARYTPAVNNVKDITLDIPPKH